MNYRIVTLDEDQEIYKKIFETVSIQESREEEDFEIKGIEEIELNKATLLTSVSPSDSDPFANISPLEKINSVHGIRNEKIDNGSNSPKTPSPKDTGSPDIRKMKGRTLKTTTPFQEYFKMMKPHIKEHQNELYPP